MEVIFWIFFSIVLGMWANRRGRLGVGWGLLAALISPILAGIVLMILPNLAEKQAQLDKINREKLTVQGSNVALSIERLHQLHTKGVISDVEYDIKKNSLIGNLRNSIIEESTEDFLAPFIPLIENNIISIEEMNKIKHTTVYRTSTSSNQICISCHKENPDGSQFCSYCGSKL